MLLLTTTQNTCPWSVLMKYLYFWLFCFLENKNYFAVHQKEMRLLLLFACFGTNISWHTATICNLVQQ